MTVTAWRAACVRNILGNGPDAGGFLGGPAKIVVHCTETGTWPGYGGGSIAPHETWRPVNGKWVKRQHISHTRSAMAMRNLSGGVQTNRDSAHQVELIGTCDRAFAKKHGYLYLPDMGDDLLTELGRDLRQLAADVDVPLRAVDTWQPYPASYGARGKTNTVRLSLSQWDNYGGILGHQHAAENTHGDPGNLDIPRALLLAGNVDVVTKVDPVKPSADGAGRTAPPFPLPDGHWFGEQSNNDRNHSGYHSATDRAHLRNWQTQMRKGRGYDIDVDGLFGKGMAHLVRVFQTRNGFKTTARIGPGIWKLAWEAKLGVGS